VKFIPRDLLELKAAMEEMALVIILTLWAVVYGVDVNATNSSDSSSSSSLSDSLPEFRFDNDDCPSRTLLMITMVFAIFAFVVAIVGVVILLGWRLRAHKRPVPVPLTQHQLIGGYHSPFAGHKSDEGSAYAHVETPGFPQIGFWPICMGVSCIIFILILIPISIWIYAANRDVFVEHHVRRHVE
jgi:hypothetical protein